MRSVRALLLGAAASAVLAYTLAAAVAIVAQSGRNGLNVHVGPLVIVAVERSQGAATTTFGTGLLVLALLGGVLNAVLAGLLARRSRRAPPMP